MILITYYRICVTAKIVLSKVKLIVLILAFLLLLFQVSVCYGVGKDATEAKSDAARNALSYLKVMAKKKMTSSASASEANGCAANPGKVAASSDKLKNQQQQPRAGILNGVKK